MSATVAEKPAVQVAGVPDEVELRATRYLFKRVFGIYCRALKWVVARTAPASAAQGSAEGFVLEETALFLLNIPAEAILRDLAEAPRGTRPTGPGAEWVGAIRSAVLCLPDGSRREVRPGRALPGAFKVVALVCDPAFRGQPFAAICRELAALAGRFGWGWQEYTFRLDGCCFRALTDLELYLGIYGRPAAAIDAVEAWYGQVTARLGVGVFSAPVAA